MRAALLGLCLLVGAHAARADDADRARLEVRASRSSVFVGEAFQLELRVLLDAVWFDEHAVPLFRRAADVPLQIVAPWWNDLPGTRPGPSAPVADGAPRIALDDALVPAAESEVRRDERVVRVLEVGRTFVADATGSLLVPAPSLRFATAQRFEEDFLGGRVAVNRREVEVPGPETRIQVLPLPETGRPSRFDGAVGRFAVSARLESASPDPAGVLHLVLRIAGDGDLRTLLVPRIEEDLPGFHVLGRRRLDADGAAAFTYDLQPPPDGTQVPEIAFHSFDPTPPGTYRVARTEALPFDRTPAPPTRPGPEEPPAPVAEDDAPAGPPALAALALLLAIAGVLVLARRRRTTGGPPDEASGRLEAARAVETAAGADAEVLSRALATYLGRVLGRAPAAAHGPDLAERLAAAGVEADAAREAQALLDGLVAARYGGAPVPSDVGERTVLLVRGLEAHAHPTTD